VRTCRAARPCAELAGLLPCARKARLSQRRIAFICGSERLTDWPVSRCAATRPHRLH
jgi:hypothetical protein